MKLFKVRQLSSHNRKFKCYNFSTLPSVYLRKTIISILGHCFYSALIFSNTAILPVLDHGSTNNSLPAKKLWHFLTCSIANEAGIFFSLAVITTAPTSLSRGILPGSYNLWTAVAQLLHGAPLEGLILKTVMRTSEAVTADLASLPQLGLFFDQMLHVIEKLNTNKLNSIHQSAYSALVRKVWPAIHQHVSSPWSCFRNIYFLVLCLSRTIFEYSALWLWLINSRLFYNKVLIIDVIFLSYFLPIFPWQGFIQIFNLKICYC